MGGFYKLHFSVYKCCLHKKKPFKLFNFMYFKFTVDVLLVQSWSLHGQPSKNRQLLYQATHPQDVTVSDWEAQAPGYSSYASSLYELANHNWIWH